MDPNKKFLGGAEQSPNLNKPVQMSLPRMSFEIVELLMTHLERLPILNLFLQKQRIVLK